MEIADILISKSGGITVTESLAKELPMIIISPIIGQETANSSFLVKHGAGIAIKEVSDLKDVLERLQAHPEDIEKMREAIRRIRKPAACYEIAKLATDMARSVERPGG
jgi:processive 1,2-diacylglycerol beta-glucosyltransferase